MRRNTLRAVGIAAVLMLAAAGCAGGDDATTSDPSGGAQDTTATDGASTESTSTDGGGSTDDGANATVPEPTDPPPSDATPEVGGTLRIGVEADVDGLNPASNVMPAVGLWMGEAVFDTLAKVGADGSAVPYLASSITPDETNTTWTVTLRPGITFHDGTPLTAEAVVATFEGQLADPLVGLTVVPLFAPDKLIEAVDDLTVVYHLAGPSSVFPLRLTGQLGVVASPTWLAAVEADPDLAQQPVGTGPFRFDQRTQDSITRFVRNDDYWAGEVYLDAVEFYPVADSLRRADQLSVGDLDMLHSPGLLADLPDDDVIRSIYDRSGEEGYLVMNTSKPPFDDIRVRQALTYAFPQRDVNTLTSDGGDVERQMANQMFDEDSKFYDPDLVQLTDRPDLVGDLISSYCADVPDQCNDGRVRITYSDTGPSTMGERIFAVIDNSWGEWFETTPRYLPQDEFIIATVTGDYQVTQFRLFGGLDPELDRVFLLCQSIGGIAVNAARYCDPELDALLERQAASTDESERIDLWRQISGRINEAFTTIWNAHTTWRIAYDSQRVQNLCGAVSPEGVPLACAVVGRTPLAHVWIDG